MNNLMIDFEVGAIGVALVAGGLFLGNVLERTFSQNDDIWALVQVFILVSLVDMVRRNYHTSANAWVLFASSVVYAQPTLLARIKRLLKLA